METMGSTKEVWSSIRQSLDVDRLECFSQSPYGATEVGCLRNFAGKILCRRQLSKRHFCSTMNCDLAQST